MGTSSPLNGRRTTTPVRSPLASPRTSRACISGGDVHIDKDPDMTKLAQEARRLSMGTAHISQKRPSLPRSSLNGGPRRPSEGYGNINGGRFSPKLNSGLRRASETPTSFARRTSDAYAAARRGSDANYATRRGSEDPSCPAHDHDSLSRRSSSELTPSELQERRRLSEAGLRRPSTSDAVLNEDTSDLMVGLPVWVDGTKHGRIAYLGGVHFAKGDMAGVHLEAPAGKNNGSVGGVMYFQCEPKHGLFARLHRLTKEPLISEEY